jgi:uncharacterized membrane protein YphA (DoxX/SURF4 family)
MRIPGWERAAPAAVALVWIYEGFWCKVCPGRADQRAIVADLPALPSGAVTPMLAAIGLAETALGLWVLSGRRARLAACVQTALLAGFNAGGLLFGADQIAEPGRMLTQNLAFLTLVWLVAAQATAASHRPATARPQATNPTAANPTAAL